MTPEARASAVTFRPWEPSFYERAARYLRADTVEFSDLTPGYYGSVFAVSDSDRENVTVAEICGCAVYHGRHDGAFAFSFPFGGGDKAAALRMIADHCSEFSLPLRFYPVGEAELAVLREVLAGEWKVTERPETADYVYLAEQLAEPEKIRVVKRALRKFEALGPWTARDAVPEDVPAMLEVLERWTSERGGADDADHDGCRDAVVNLGREGTLTTVVEQNGRLVSFEIGRRLNSDMLVAEFEKCVPQVPGGCQVANREFVRRWAGSSTFVNRSCDMGEPGLAKAKQMYRPCRMVRKFVAEKTM